VKLFKLAWDLAGDHAIFLGRVVRARHQDRPPLVHWRGGYHNIA
jgi:flavin reductase (DIM6/NTAB) family NADH-FMN oxidoreductase RutF